MSVDGMAGPKSSSMAGGTGSSGVGSSSRGGPERGMSPSPSVGSDKQLTEKELRVTTVASLI